MAASVNIVEALPAHDDAIAAVTRASFQGSDEVELIHRLRDAGLVVLSLVALKEDDIVGHILFSRLHVSVDSREIHAVSLAPMSVSPKLQGKGIGSALIREALQRLPKLGCEAVIVLGHPGYYPRFGFSAALAAKFESPYPREAFMALELVPGILTGNSGTLSYPKAFGLGTHS